MATPQQAGGRLVEPSAISPGLRMTNAHAAIDRKMTSMAIVACVALITAAGGCQRQQGPTPADVRAHVARHIPANVDDRAGWAHDIQAAFSAQRIAPTTEHICAVLAVIEQESTYRADPAVPGLAKIARAEIDRRAAAVHVPAFVIDAALRVHAPDGSTYAEHLQQVRTEQDLSALFEEMIQRVPLGRHLLAGLNPVHTAGPMQVSIAFAQAHAHDYPFPLDGSIRQEVFTRRGGLYFGIEHLLGYPAHYARPLYRFADFNAGWYASRNAAFQRAVAIASGKTLALDGDLIRPRTPLESPGATEAALRHLGPALAMDDAAIRRDLQLGDRIDFENTRLYRSIYSLAEARARGPLARARVPDIALHGPKLHRKLSTAWYADRVNARFVRCMGRD
jgi:hypothetical protein